MNFPPLVGSRNGIANLLLAGPAGVAEALDVTLDDLLRDSTAKEQRTRRRSSVELPPGLAEVQDELALSGNALSEDNLEKLAQVNFRGNRPRDKEGWRFVLQAIKMAVERSGQK
jgi:hypothetical protein